MNTLKLSETVEKGKHLEKFGLAENKAGPEREYILQVGIKWNTNYIPYLILLPAYQQECRSEAGVVCRGPETSTAATGETQYVFERLCYHGIRCALYRTNKGTRQWLKTNRDAPATNDTHCRTALTISQA